MSRIAAVSCTTGGSLSGELKRVPYSHFRPQAWSLEMLVENEVRIDVTLDVEVLVDARQHDEDEFFTIA
jgi:hypothetical protein